MVLFEFVAIGPESHLYWRREITPGVTVRLGRLPDSGWEVSWDRRISREHADLFLDGERLKVRCLSTAKNSAYIAGTPVRDFAISPGEQFRIGDTVFRFETVSKRMPHEHRDDFFPPEAAGARTETSRAQEIQALRDELASLQRQLAQPAQHEANEARIQRLLADINQVKELWQSESAALRETNRQLGDEVSELRSNLEAAEEAHRQANERLEQQTAEICKANEENKQHLAEIDKLKENCATLQAGLDSEKKAHQQTQQEVKQQQQDAAELRQRCIELTSQWEAEKQAVQKSQRRLSDAEQLQHRCDELTAQVQAEQKACRQANEKAEQAAKQADSLQSQLGALRKDLETVTSREKEAATSLRRTKEALQKATAVARQEAQTVTRQREEINSLKSETGSLKQEFERTKETARREEATAARLHDEVDALKVEFEKLSSQLTDAEAARRQAELDASQQAEEAEHAARENETLQAELDALRAELRAKDAAVRRAELTARHKTDEASRYLDQLKEVRSEVLNLRVRSDSGSSGSGSRAAQKSGSGSQSPASESGKPPMEQGSTLSKASALGTFGQYKIIEQIGQGGMGTVFKAVHTRLERIVALKIVTGGRLQSEEKLARFNREMKAIGRLSHPNLVQALDAGENNHCLYLVMEFVEGLDVGGLVQRIGSLPVADACEIMRQSAIGLDYIHKQGLVHRDIKPSNLMITPHEHVKILDLGLALLGDLGDGLTQTGQLMGTLDYMAPEQAGDSHQVDHRADVYSLGCTFYQLLSGKVPFGGVRYLTVVKKIMAHAKAEPPKISGVCSDLPKEVADLLNRMLAKDADERPQSMSEVARCLENHRSGTSLSNLLIEAGALHPGLARTTLTINTGIDSTNVSDEKIGDDDAARRNSVEVKSDAEIDTSADQ